MSIINIPGFIVAIVTLFAIIKSGNDTDSESIKKGILITTIKNIVVSIFIVLLILSVIYYLNVDFKIFESYKQFIVQYFFKSFFFVFLDIVLVQIISAFFLKDYIQISNNRGVFGIKLKTFYENNFSVEIFYLIKKFRNVVKYYALIYTFKIFLFLSFAVLFLVPINFLQDESSNDFNYPYVTSEKMFIRSTQPIQQIVVRDGKIRKEYLPMGMLFSITEGTNFSITTDKLKDRSNSVGEEIRNEVYGITTNDTIYLASNSKIYYEGVLDKPILFGNHDGKISDYHTVKTVPGETYLRLDSEMEFRVDTSLKDNHSNYYKFVIGKLTKENQEKKFLNKLNILNILFLLLITVIFFISLPKLFLYILGFLLIFIILFNIFIMINSEKIQNLWIMLPVILLIILSLEMNAYRVFLKNNILIRRIKKMSMIKVEIKKDNTKVTFNRNDKASIYKRILDRGESYKEKFTYISKGNKIERELSIIVYNSRRTILCKYFRVYSPTFKWIRKLKNKD